MALCCAATGAFGSGGIHFDDFSVTNNGSTVFSDNFDDGNISDWTSKDHATLDSSVSHSSPFSLHLNHTGGVVSEAFHSISTGSAGLVEASSWVWLPSVQEQAESTFTNIVLYSGNTSDNIFTGVTLKPGETGYRIWLHWNNNSGADSTITTSSVILPSQTWALLTLRLNSSNSMASALLNGQEQASFSYTSASFTSFDHTSVWGWLGGEQSVPEPSSLVALLCGAGGMISLLRRKARP